ncbi:FtsX-like permease family protein [Micromonospora sp. LOL_021]|uniref:FtsX-like permease family protein n=1 Tax=Micromonospora sp. LOL_021 TaxID=3345417 RepID=UPI003A8BAB2B
MIGANLVGPSRVALRLARRSALRHRGRSVLVLLMLFIPAYAGTILTASWSNLGGTSAQEITFTLGGADLIVGSGDLAAVEATLPPGSDTTGLIQASTVLRTPAGLRAQEYEATDPAHPANDGRYVVRSGRAPDGSAEVAVTRRLAADLGLRLGSSVTAGMPQRELTVVGVVDWSRSLRTSGLLVPHGFPLSSAPGKLMVRLPDGDEWMPPRMDAGSGNLSVLSREQMAPTAGERRLEAAAALLVVTFAGAQVVLLVGAAFLVGAARQRRELALVSAAGATPRQVTWIVVAGGLLLGVVAAFAAVLLGLATFAAAAPLIEQVANHPLIDVSLPAGRLLGVVGVTLCIAMLATLLPARAVRQGSVRGALGGQRDTSKVDGLGAVAGLALLVVGIVALLVSGNPQGRPQVLAAGGVALLLGVVAGTPTLVRMSGRVAGLLPMPSRLALRHAARHRLRTAAAVAAVTAAVAGSVALALAGAARGEVTPSRLDARPGQVLVSVDAAEKLGPDGLRRVAGALPSRATVTVITATDLQANVAHHDLPAGPTATVSVAAEQRDVAVGGAEVVQLVTGRPATRPEREALDRGDAVAFNDTLVTPDDRVALSSDGQGLTLLPAVVASRSEYYARLPGLVIAPETAQRIGLDTRVRLVVVDTTRMPDEQELAAANSILLAAQLTAAEPPASPVTVDAVPADDQSSREVGVMFYLLATVSVLVTVVASTVAVGLASVELRPDLATMAAIGAAPRVRRRITTAQAWLIVGVGTALGLLSGIGPAAAYVSFSTELHWHVPWLALSAIVLGPPLLAVIMAGRLVLGEQTLVRRLN